MGPGFLKLWCACAYMQGLAVGACVVARLVVGMHTVMKAWASGRALGQLWAHEQLCKSGLPAFTFMATETSAGTSSQRSGLGT